MEFGKIQNVSKCDENNCGLKSDIDEIDVDNLKPVSDYSYELSNVVEKEVCK